MLFSENMEMGLLITGVGVQEAKQIDLKCHVNRVSVHCNVLLQAIKAAGTGRHTKDYHSGRGAASLSHNVAGQTGVVARVGQPGLVDDEVVVCTGVDVVVGQGT